MSQPSKRAGVSSWKDLKVNGSISGGEKGTSVLTRARGRMSSSGGIPKERSGERQATEMTLSERNSHLVRKRKRKGSDQELSPLGEGGRGRLGNSTGGGKGLCARKS